MSSDRYLRQSFLGLDSEEFIRRCTVTVLGLGGGGSHVVQQLAHIGFQNYVLYDSDSVEESNLNRLIGAKAADALAETPKLHLAKMMIYGLQPQARIRGFACSGSPLFVWVAPVGRSECGLRFPAGSARWRSGLLQAAAKWQEHPEPMRESQIVIGCVDSYKGREELEIACRRYLMHYIDIGMDVHGRDRYVIGGQIIQSSPGGLCMRCMSFLTNEKLAKEAALYGNAGGRPQVIWPNGVLASTAVGLVVDLVTNWTRKQRSHAYLVYDGNEGTVMPSVTLRNLNAACPHFSAEGIGDPVLVEL